MNDRSDDALLVTHARAGCRDAFQRLVERHLDAVCAVAFAATGRREDSEEVAQEVFLRAWTRLHTLRDPARFAGWLLRITRNTARSWLRASRRREQATARLRREAIHPSQERDGENHEAVWRALERLPASQREPLVLYYRCGESSRAVAEQLGLSVDAVHQRMSRARQRLRAELQRELGEGVRRTRPSKRLAIAIVAALPQRGVVSATPSRALRRGVALAGGVLGIAVALTASGGGAVASIAAVDDMRSAAAPLAAATGTGLRFAGTRSAKAPMPMPPQWPLGPAYQVTHRADGWVAVDLSGGASTSLDTPCLLPAEDEQALWGRVVDARGRGIVGAVVVAGPSVTRFFTTSLVAAGGTTTGATGEFEFSIPAGAEARVVAMHPRGWVEPLIVTGDELADGVTLELQPAARLEVSVSQGGAPLRADVWLLSDDLGPPLMLRYATDEAGDLLVPHLFGGPIRVRAQRPMDSSHADAGPTVGVTVDLVPGEGREVHLELPVGRAVEVTAVVPSDASVSRVEHTLLLGDLDVPDADALRAHRAAFPEDEQRWVVRGEAEATGTLRYPDVPFEEHTACAEAFDPKGDSTGLTCTRVPDAGFVSLRMELPR